MSARIFFGWILMLVGLLIALVSGGCIVTFGVPEVLHKIDQGRWGRVGEMLLTLSLVGGIPFIIGVLLMRGGRRMSRSDWNVRAPETTSSSSSSFWGRVGEELGYALREIRDEIAHFVPGLVRKEGRAPSDDNGAGKAPKDDEK
ncbi:MAG: hypothetical protein ACAH83_08665 [Alphaproteobacteria bacterium]